MVDFSQLSNTQLIQWVDEHFEHFERFAGERDDDFPENVLYDLGRDTLAIVRRPEGFAIAFKGHLHRLTPGGIPADLMFLYVLPEHQGRGIARVLVEEVKKLVTPGVPLLLTCEGMRRKGIFERLGFAVTGYPKDGDLYEMQWNAPAPDAA